MKVTGLFYKIGYTQDGYLDKNQGRIVIYGDKAEMSRGNSRDHLALLSALASKYKLNKDEVISNAIRLYYSYENGNLIISPNRKLDDDMFEKDKLGYLKLILDLSRG